MTKLRVLGALILIECCVGTAWSLLLAHGKRSQSKIEQDMIVMGGHLVRVITRPVTDQDIYNMIDG